MQSPDFIELLGAMEAWTASIRTSGSHGPISAFEPKLMVNYRLSGIHLSGDYSHSVSRIKRSVLVGAQVGSRRKADVQ